MDKKTADRLKEMLQSIYTEEKDNRAQKFLIEVFNRDETKEQDLSELENLLVTLKEYHPNRLICLFGCGGNRAKSRRYEMGEVSARLADFTVVTSDNPRYEQPIEIINDILTGVKKVGGAYVAIPDRKEAIAYCIQHAQKGDVIVLAGKGHEDYQEIKGQKYHMAERELIQEVLSERAHTKEGNDGK